MQNIKNIIFDLGGVIMNIDFKKTEEAFHLLGLENFSDHISQFHITDFFEKYETGMLSDEDFVRGLREISGKEIPGEKIVAAWNALLLDFPPKRINTIPHFSAEQYKFYSP
jgi:glucose-1-phosphatase